MEAELALINKVELRIALAGPDDKFEQALNLYLAPLLLKLASPHSQVRSQILKSIRHLITRINAAATIKLPVEKLISQVQTPVAPPGADVENVRLYSLIFIAKGIDRLSTAEKLSYAPKVVENISTFKINIQARLFYCFLKMISVMQDPNDLVLTLSDKDDHFLIQQITKFFLFKPAKNEDGSNRTPENYTCPGLNFQDCAFLTTYAGITYDSRQMAQFKTPLLCLLTSWSKIQQSVVPLMGASCDSLTEISDKAKSTLKRITIDYEDPYLVDTLIALYLGNPIENRPPVSSVMREQILLQVLSHSEAAARSLQASAVSLAGLESHQSKKLKAASIQFIQWVTQNSSISNDDIQTDKDEEFAIRIAGELKQDLNSTADGISGEADHHSYASLRENQYQALGSILKRNPKLLNGIEYITFLFEKLTTESLDLRPTVQSILSGLAVHLSSMSEEDKMLLKSACKQYLSDDTLLREVSNKHALEGFFACRYIAIKFVNACFPFSDMEARMLCVLGTSPDNRPNIIEEATKGLHPYWFNVLQSSNTLEFKSTPELLGANKNTFEFPDFRQAIDVLSNCMSEGYQKEFPALANCMATALNFVNQCLVMQSVRDHKSVIVPDQEWAVRVEKALLYDEDVLNLLKKKVLNISSTEEKYIQDFEIGIQWNSLDLFFDILAKEFLGKDALRNKASKTFHDSETVVFGKHLLFLISISTNPVISRVVSYLKDFHQMLVSKTNSASDGLISHIAQVIGVIGTHPDVSNDELVKLMQTLIHSYQTKSKDSSLLCLGYLLSRAFYRGRQEVITQEVYKTLVEAVISGIDSSSARLSNQSMDIVSQLAAFGALGPQSHLLGLDISTYRTTLRDALQAKVKKCDEKAVNVWADLSLTFEEVGGLEANALNEFESSVYDSHVSKQIEYLFSSGEALSVIVGGWNSKVLHRLIDINDTSCYENLIFKEARLPTVLNKVLQACSNTKPSLRRAGCIWLLSLVQYLPRFSGIVDKAPEIHIAFMRFLADRDELIQESASRGLSLIYEMGDAELKDSLVRGLLRSFTDSTTTKSLVAGSIGEDTELFEPGVLKTHDGSVSTYKDILNLASEVGDPSLVYKFMSLARHSSLWSSRKGIAFGLGSILSKSSLEELLASDDKVSNKLIPKLFRYKFDPSPSVAKSMDDIWTTLISDTSKTINDYFQVIMDEVLNGIGSREWRIRQASTAALSFLIQSSAFEKYEAQLNKIWLMSLRSVDDIKESVRKEGTKLSRTLATILVRNINIESNSSLEKSNAILEKLIPTLLGTQGLLSDVEDIRNFALDTILKLTKKSGVAIKPFIPQLIEQLISLMSTLEPQVINYLTLNADKYNMKASDIDAKRLQGIGRSPMMDAIERLLDKLDDETMKALVPALRSSIRHSVGLPSKAAGSKVLVSLVVRHLYIVKPYGDQLLKICQAQLKDRNETISSSFAGAAGYLCRVASIDAVVKYAKSLQKLYFESDNETSRKIAGVAAEAVSKHSGDMFSKVSSEFLPFAFIAKHDPESSISELFDSIWSDNTAGNGAIRLYIREISELARANFDSQQYIIKQVCAKSIAVACKKVDQGSNGIGVPVEDLFDILIEACKGRSWLGKEDVFDALVSLSIKSKYELFNKDDLFEKVKKVVLTEARRKNRDYKEHAVKSMGNFVRELNELQEEYVEIMEDYIQNQVDDEMDQDDDDNGNSKKAKVEVSKSSRKNLKKEEKSVQLINTLVSSFSITQDGDYNKKLLSLVFDLMLQLLQSNKIIITWRSQVGISQNFSSICKQFVKSALVFDEINLEKAKQVYAELHRILDVTIENVILQFVRAVKELALAVDEEPFIDAIHNDLRQLGKKQISSVLRLEIEAALKN